MTIAIQHKELAARRWIELTLVQQLGNVGSEINRAATMKEKDATRYASACDRALELMDLILQDKRWKGLRLRELARAREMICDAVLGGREYGSTFEDMDRYFFAFALLARLKT